MERRDDLLRLSLDCVHCGLCLPACPTYRETGREVSSPRGRIYLMRGVAEERIPMGPTVVEEAYLCLGCRACETACPSGVQFGSMIEKLRAEVEDAGLRTGLAHRVEGWALRGVLPHKRRLRLFIDLLAVVKRLRLDRLAAPFLPAGLRDATALLPDVPPRRARRPLPPLVPAEGERRGRVGFLTGCVMSELFADVNAATVRVLARNGFDVVMPRDQGCCGALHAHAGDEATAHSLARVNVDVFTASGVETVVTNSAGCGAAMRDVLHWLPGAGERFASGVRDVAELLDAEGLRAPGGRIDASLCYDDPCHLVHGQRVGDAPRRLLKQIPGLDFVAHDDPGSCCGAAGIYNLTHRKMSRAVLDRKLDALAAADPDLIATGNPGCLMQLRGGAARRGLRARVVHPVELLDASYRDGSSGEAESPMSPSRRIL